MYVFFLSEYTESYVGLKPLCVNTLLTNVADSDQPDVSILSILFLKT